MIKIVLLIFFFFRKFIKKRYFSTKKHSIFFSLADSYVKCEETILSKALKKIFEIFNVSIIFYLSVFSYMRTVFK